jgi:hypothetical protein
MAVFARQAEGVRDKVVARHSPEHFKQNLSMIMKDLLKS